MTRRITALLSLLSLLAMAALADNQVIDISLNPENGYCDTTSLDDMGKIYVHASPDPNNDKASISIQVQNLTGDRGLLLFNRNYSEEKETKKGDFKKNYFEILWPDVLKTTGIWGTEGLQPDVFFIAQGHTKELPLQIPQFGNETKTLNICFYPCVVEKKNKDGLPQKARISAEYKFSIKINVELGPDTEFEELKARCEAFIKEINEKTFKNAAPKPLYLCTAIQGQVDELGKKSDTITREIRDCARNRGIMNADISDSKYGKLLVDVSHAYSAKLDDFNSEHPTCIKNCGHPEYKRCEWCKKTIGNGKNQCHRKGTCDKCGKPIGCEKGCKKNHRKDPPMPWKEAKQKLGKIEEQMSGRKPLPCDQAKRQAQSIWDKAQKSPKDKYYQSAKVSYDRIMQCK